MTKRIAALLIAATLLAGCRGASVSQADNQILCNTKGEAFHVEPGIGDTSFVKRLPSADAVCLPQKS